MRFGEGGQWPGREQVIRKASIMMRAKAEERYSYIRVSYIRVRYTRVRSRSGLTLTSQGHMTIYGYNV